MKPSSFAIAAALFGFAGAASAQIALEYGQPSSAVASKINVKKVPVTFNGVTKYYDFTTAYKLNANGVPVLDATNSTFAVVAAPVVPTLKSGGYVDQDGRGVVISTGGPDTAGRLSYQLTASNTTNNVAAQLITGPITGHPYRLLIEQCGMGVGPAFGVHSDEPNALAVGTASGNQLSVTMFYCNNGTATPQSTLSYRLF